MLKQKFLLFFLILCFGCQKKSDTFEFVFDDKKIAVSFSYFIFCKKIKIIENGEL